FATLRPPTRQPPKPTQPERSGEVVFEIHPIMDLEKFVLDDSYRKHVLDVADWMETRPRPLNLIQNDEITLWANAEPHLRYPMLARMTPVFLEDNAAETSRTVLSPLAA
ncbi:MAG: hypothetical protein ACOC3D_04370, partial [Pseudomonadota bacterium]